MKIFQQIIISNYPSLRFKDQLALIKTAFILKIKEPAVIELVRKMTMAGI
jgi:hypothetical protein